MYCAHCLGPIFFDFFVFFIVFLLVRSFSSLHANNRYTHNLLLRVYILLYKNLHQKSNIIYEQILGAIFLSAFFPFFYYTLERIKNVLCTLLVDCLYFVCALYLSHFIQILYIFSSVNYVPWIVCMPSVPRHQP